MQIWLLILVLFATVAVQAFVYKKGLFKKLDYQCGFSTAEASEGENIYLVETIYNKKLLPLPWIKVNMTASRWLEFAGALSTIAQDTRYVTSAFFLRSYQRTIRRWNLKCLKRGVYRINNVTLVSGDLFGLYVNSQPFHVGAELMVFPATVQLEEMLASARQLQGDTVVKRWIVDDPFYVQGAREYIPGDPLNRIHWQATAKTGLLMTKKNEFTSQYSVTVILNIQSIEHEYNDVVKKDLIEFGIKVVSTVLDRAFRMGMPVRFATNGYSPEEEKGTVFTVEAAGRDHLRALLKILATLQIKIARYFEPFLEELIPQINNSQVILVTAYLSASMCEKARKLKANGNEVKIIVTEYVEKASIPEDLDIYFVIRDGLKNVG